MKVNENGYHQLTKNRFDDSIAAVMGLYDDQHVTDVNNNDGESKLEMTLAPSVTTDSPPLVRFHARRLGSKAPFSNESIHFQLVPGACVHLVGNSGVGKTTLAMALAGLDRTKTSTSTSKQHQHHYYYHRELDLDVSVEWDPSIPINERCGVLFQQTTLLDELTVAGNLCVALQNSTTGSQAASEMSTATTTATSSQVHQQQPQQQQQLQQQIKQLLELVGLDYARDANKRPCELSGGMGRRASLALQLAQHKRVIVLDEPFTGLDHDAAVSVAKELVHLRQFTARALVLISHEPEIAAIVMDRKKTKNNHVVPLKEAHKKENDRHVVEYTKMKQLNLCGVSLKDRIVERLYDYVVYSWPLISLAFAATGLAISMLSADLLQRLDVTEHALEIISKEVQPLIKLLTGEEPSALTMFGVNIKVRSMLNATIPQAKSTIFALGMAKLFVLEVGPLLTALLLCGRIGGAYAGRVATMQATKQTALLSTLGVNPVLWTLLPSLVATIVASPLLTVWGTAVALALGAMVGPHYGLGNRAFYKEQLSNAILPELRLRCLHKSTDMSMLSCVKAFRLQTTYSDSTRETMIELITYPVVYHVVKALVYSVAILTIAQACALLHVNVTPRGVPIVITSAVVVSGLLIIVLDGAFSQLLLLRH